LHNHPWAAFQSYLFAETGYVYSLEASDAGALPSSSPLDKGGRIRYRVTAELEWDCEEVVSISKKLINQEPENKP